jgi:hypothetical protein
MHFPHRPRGTPRRSRRSDRLFAYATPLYGAKPGLRAPEQLPLDGRIRLHLRQHFLEDRECAPSCGEFHDLLAEPRMVAQVALEVLVRFRVAVRDVIEKSTSSASYMLSSIPAYGHGMIHQVISFRLLQSSAAP